MGVVWFRADLLSGVTLYYISLLSVISEMHEQITTEKVGMPANSYALSSYSFAQIPMHLVHIRCGLMASITKES